MAWGQVGNILGPEGPPGPNFVLGGTKTAAFSCDADTFYLVNFPADLGAQTIQLPAAPAQGTRIAFYRLDTNAYTSFANITHGAGDTGDYVLGNSGAACTLQYVGTAWLQVAASFAGLQGLIGAASTATYPPNLMTRDGSGRTEVAAPSTAAQAANKGYVDARMPTGSITMFGGAAAPTGWLLCDGSSLLRADYADLFAVIGTTYGSVDGTHFTLPNMASKFPRGNTPGTGAGADSHQHAVTGLTANSHTHDIAATSHTHSLGAAWADISASTASPYAWIRRKNTDAWTPSHSIGGTAAAGGYTTSSSVGTAIGGSSDAPDADVGGTSGTASANGISGSVDSGDNVPAYVAFAFIIKT